MRNRLSEASVICLIVVTVLLTSVPGARAATLQNKITARLPYSVLVAHKALEPGSYTFREVSEKVLQVFDNYGRRPETFALTTQTFNNKPAPETVVVLRKLGNEYYIDQIWMQGRMDGYQFPIPKSATAKSWQMTEMIVIPAFVSKAH